MFFAEHGKTNRKYLYNLFNTNDYKIIKLFCKAKLVYSTKPYHFSTEWLNDTVPENRRQQANKVTDLEEPGEKERIIKKINCLQTNHRRKKWIKHICSVWCRKETASLYNIIDLTCLSSLQLPPLKET